MATAVQRFTRAGFYGFGAMNHAVAQRTGDATGVGWPRFSMTECDRTTGGVEVLPEAMMTPPRTVLKKSGIGFGACSSSEKAACLTTSICLSSSGGNCRPRRVNGWMRSGIGGCVARRPKNGSPRPLPKNMWHRSGACSDSSFDP